MALLSLISITTQRHMPDAARAAMSRLGGRYRSGRRRQRTQLLQQAFKKASELPQEEQNRFARFLLAELGSERQWAELFARPESEALLERLADEALATHRAGLTRPLNPEEL